MKHEAPLFELQKVRFKAGTSTLLDDIDLSIEPERVTGLIGHNGSGKTTLMRLLARHHTQHAGAIRFHGEPIVAWKPREFARRVAHLPQEYTVDRRHAGARTRRARALSVARQSGHLRR